MVCPYSLSVRGGVQNHALGLGHWLANQGHEVHVLAPGKLPDELARRYPGIEVTSAGPSLPVPYNGSVARVNFGVLTARRVGRWLRSVQPHLLHLHEPITPSVSILGLWQAPAGVPVMATFHTATPRSRTMHLARRVLAPSIQRIGGGIAVSSVAADVVLSHLGRRVPTVGNGFEFAEFGAAGQRASGSELGPSGPRITFLGRLNEPRKGLSVLTAAWPQIEHDLPGARVTVAGSGRPALPSAWRALGEISDTERVALLGETDIFVAPHVARESFGLVLLEALAAGTRLVASDLPAFRDVLDDGAGPVASMFTPGDAGALTAAVRESWSRPSSPERGLALARRYDWDSVGPQILAEYDQLLAPIT